MTKNRPTVNLSCLSNKAWYTFELLGNHKFIKLLTLELNVYNNILLHSRYCYVIHSSIKFKQDVLFGFIHAKMIKVV